MNNRIGTAHLRLLGYVRSRSQNTTHMWHPHTQITLYYSYSEQTWRESGMSFKSAPTEILRVLNYG